jgi:hypothetical protein
MILIIDALNQEIISGWWCNNHLEKYESQWERLSHILWKFMEKNVPNHQPDIKSARLFAQIMIDSDYGCPHVQRAPKMLPIAPHLRHFFGSPRIQSRIVDSSQHISTNRTNSTPQHTITYRNCYGTYLNH